MEEALEESAPSSPPAPGAWAPPPHPLSAFDAAGASGEWGPAAPAPCLYPAPALYQTLPGWGWGWDGAPEDSIPAAWGANGASEAWRSATWPPAELGAAELMAGGLPAAAWEQQGMEVQQPCCLDPACGGCPLPHPAAGWAVDPQQQYEAFVATAQQQQYAMLAAAAAAQQVLYYQQCLPPQPGPPLAFAISPPAQAQQATAPARRLARKKKAALPAEPSFGCNADGLGGGGSSAALVFSGEPSAAEVAEVLEGAEHGQQGDSGGGEGDGAGGGALGLPPIPERPAHGGKQPQQPSIAYDRSPRPTAWAAYTYAEYQRRGFDPKAAPKYWQLPTSLGPDRGAQWQAQLSKHERQQRFGEAASQQNRQHIAANPPPQRAPQPKPGADVRERALRFARTAVPKPSSFKSTAGSRAGVEGSSQGVEAAAAAAAAAVEDEQAAPPVVT